MTGRQRDVDFIRSSLIGFIGGIPVAIFRGFTASKLWSWFVLDAYPSAPNPGVIRWIGIAFIVLVVSHSYSAADMRAVEEDGTTYHVVLGLLETVVVCALSLVGAFFWKAFL